MASRRTRQPGRRHSGELLLLAVNAVVPDDERELYLPFARELYATLHQSRKLGTVPRSANVGLGAVQSPFSADFSRRTKMTVMKWFRRGLSGHLMWLIGERLMGRMHPSAGNAVKAG